MKKMQLKIALLRGYWLLPKHRPILLTPPLFAFALTSATSRTTKFHLNLLFREQAFLHCISLPLKFSTFPPSSIKEFKLFRVFPEAEPKFQVYVVTPLTRIKLLGGVSLEDVPRKRVEYVEESLQLKFGQMTSFKRGGLHIVAHGKLIMRLSRSRRR